jgi:hypothetical protein
MGTGTNFNPDILEEAYSALAQIPSTITASRSMRNLAEVSEIHSDISAMDDKNGGWTFLGEQVSGVTSAVSQYVTQLQQAASQVNAAMRASIDTLQGADTSTKKTLQSPSTDAYGRH